MCSRARYRLMRYERDVMDPPLVPPSRPPEGPERDDLLLFMLPGAVTGLGLWALLSQLFPALGLLAVLISFLFGTFVAFGVLPALTGVGFVEVGSRTDPARMAAEIVTDVQEEISTSSMTERQSVRRDEAQPAVEPIPRPQASEEPASDEWASLANRIEAKISDLLDRKDRRNRRLQWMFFGLGIPAGIIINWISLKIFGS